MTIFWIVTGCVAGTWIYFMIGGFVHALMVRLSVLGWTSTPEIDRSIASVFWPVAIPLLAMFRSAMWASKIGSRPPRPPKPKKEKPPVYFCPSCKKEVSTGPMR